MPRSASVLCILILTLLSLTATAIPQSARGAQSRTFISGPRPETSFTFTQVKNPKWKPREVSTTALYAAGFLKHKSRMPDALQGAWNELQSREAQGSEHSLNPRVSGETVRY